MKTYDCLPFYEYYFEPGKNMGMVFFQFMNRDFEKGKRAKRCLENFMLFSQIFIFCFFILCIVAYCRNLKFKRTLLCIFIIVYMTRFLNPLSSQVGLYKAQQCVIKKYL